MQRHSDNVQDTQGNAIAQVLVTVRDEATNVLASLHETSHGPVKANPFIADDDGEFFFYAPNGTYNVTLEGPVSDIRRAVLLYDPLDAQGTPRLQAISAAQSLQPGTVYLVDVTAGALVLTLPNPAPTATVAPIIVHHVAGSASTNPITLRRGLTTTLINGTATDVGITSNNNSLEFTWAGTLGWIVRRMVG